DIVMHGSIDRPRYYSQTTRRVVDRVVMDLTARAVTQRCDRPNIDPRIVDRGVVTDVVPNDCVLLLAVKASVAVEYHVVDEIELEGRGGICCSWRCVLVLDAGPFVVHLVV